MPAHIVNSPDYFSQNSRINDAAWRQVKLLILLNLISSQALTLDHGVSSRRVRNPTLNLAPEELSIMSAFALEGLRHPKQASAAIHRIKTKQKPFGRFQKNIK